jgi:hypothetical protein
MPCAGPPTHRGQDRDRHPHRVPNVFARQRARSRDSFRAFLGGNGGPQDPSERLERESRSSDQRVVMHPAPGAGSGGARPATGLWALNSIIPRASNPTGGRAMCGSTSMIQEKFGLPPQHRAGSWSPPPLGIGHHVVPIPLATPKRKTLPPDSPIPDALPGFPGVSRGDSQPQRSCRVCGTPEGGGEARGCSLRGGARCARAFSPSWPPPAAKRWASASPTTIDGLQPPVNGAVCGHSGGEWVPRRTLGRGREALPPALCRYNALIPLRAERKKLDSGLGIARREPAVGELLPRIHP